MRGRHSLLPPAGEGGSRSETDEGAGRDPRLGGRWLLGDPSGIALIRPAAPATFSRWRGRRIAPLLAAVLFCLAFAPAHAVEPGEMLSDSALEARARSVSEGLRCLVCQNESIDESHADLAKDIRVLVRQRLVAGDTNQQVRDYLVARYGQFILLKPPLETQTLLLWGTPLIVLVLGGIGIAFAVRRGAKPSRDPARPLSEAERAKLDEMLAER